MGTITESELAAHDRALREQIAREYGIGDLTSRPLRDAQDKITRLESLVNYLRRENRRLENTLARRDQRCEDLAASLDDMRRDLLHAERWEQEVTDVLHTVHTMCLHGDPHHQIAEYIEHHDHRYQAPTKENQTDE